MARTRQEIEAEISELQRLASRRRAKPGFSENVAAIEEQIAASEAELAELDEGSNG